MAESRPFTHSQAMVPDDYHDVLLNRYRIMSSGESGGFGTVLTCWDTRLQRRVAIKRLPLVGTGAPASSTLGDALTEARTSSMLVHPNIVTVFDFELEGSYAYLVMEYVDGMTLSKLLERVEGGTLTHDEAACLVQSVASAVGFAHENGVLHMDIKPSNIMIDRKGNIKLYDFGMATLASAAGYAGARGGTVGYMPPEQIEGDVVDERTDVFSLAVVIWQSLLGYNPFAAETAEKSLALIKKGPGSPSKYDPELAGMAEEALLGALAASPAARIPSVETLAKELVFALGDPAQGAESLRNLVSQNPSNPSDDPEDWEGERLPLAVSYPWLPKAFARLASASVTLWLAWRVAPALFNHGSPAAAPSRAAWAFMAIATLLAALWPPLGSVLVWGAFCTCIALCATTAAPLLLAIVLAIAFVLWWGICAPSSDLSTPAVALPACLCSPLAGSALSGVAFGPAAAFFTASAAWFVGRIWPPVVAAGFALDNMVDALLTPLVSGPALMSLAGCGVGAALCAAITRSGTSVTRAVMGQVVGCILLVSAQLVAARMENGGIWADPSWANTGIAVLLCVLVCVACVLHGPRATDLESEV